MSLQIKQKHQFHSEEYNMNFDILQMSNNEIYLNIEQLESVFNEKFDDYMTEQNKDQPYRKTYPKAVQFYLEFGYITPEDFEKDMILEIDNVLWLSFSYICPFIARQNHPLFRSLIDFRKLIFIII